MKTSVTQAQPPRPGDAYIQSFARGLAVIRAFNAAAPRQTLTEVANATGLTRAGARRVLLTLQTLGYVASDGKFFQLTPKVLDLGFAYLSSMPLWSRAEPFMEGLTQRVQESCTAAVLDDTDIVFVIRIPIRKILRISLGVGSRLPAYCTSMGRTLLAGLGDDEVRTRLLRSDPRPMTKYTVTDIDDLCSAVAQVRAQGWSIVCQELEEGLISISAPIVDRSNRTVAALNISGNASTMSPEAMQASMLAPLLETADQISRLVID